MKENNKQTRCESKGSLTQVSTTYARICVILLALNFCITGYVLTGVLKIQQETAQTESQVTTVPTTVKLGTTSQTETVPTETPEGVKILEKE